MLPVGFLPLTVFSSLFLLSLTGVSQSSEPDPSLAKAALKLLDRNCLICHGAVLQSGLDMRQKETLLKGGDRGPALIPGNAEESLLFMAVAHVGELKMPPNESAMPKADLEVLRDWINAGAPWDSADSHAPSVPSWWSFRRPQQPSIPETSDQGWTRTPIDAFILARLEKEGLKPAPPANRQQLIRRAYFDLIGLPPTPEQVHSFLQDSSPNAYERMIGELLESPRYGERWARHWLDVVRYADSSGFESDHYYPNAWRYRDYVIKSFNDDKPYDRFVQEQIAGDELWPQRFELPDNRTIPLKKNEYLEARLGTGFYALGPETLESLQYAEQHRAEELTDWADTTSAAFLGLTVGCARCHNHKFDPITQRDYYSFQAIFENSRKVEISVMSPIQEVTRNVGYPNVVSMEEARLAYRLFEKKVKARIVENTKKEFPPEVVAAYEIDKDERSSAQEELAKPLIKAIRSVKFDEALTEQEQEQEQELLNRLARAVLKVSEIEGSNLVRFEGLLEIPRASVLGHFNADVVPPVHLLHRGQFEDKKQKSTPTLPQVLSQTTDPEGFFSESMGTRSRKQLALWLTLPDHPLTARVMVNRIWQWHFGQGLLRTPNDFGRQGELPSHPQLLDWLANEFTARNWSLKSMHWLIMNSSTYRMSSLRTDSEASLIDPDNRFLWRMNRTRLEAETLWDSMLSIAGTLNLKMYGRPAIPPLSEEELVGTYGRWPIVAVPADHYRRGIYILAQRNLTFPMFEAFDNPQSAVSCPRRDVTTVTPQALWFLNNRIAFEQAGAFAARLVSRNGENQGGWVDDAWRLALNRPPSDQEKQEALELLSTRAHQIEKARWTELSPGLEDLPLSKAAALTELCLSLFNLNEFLYID